MHLKGAEVDTDDLVAEKRDLWAILGAPHGDCELGGVSLILRANLHITSFDKNVMSVKSTHMVGIRAGREDERALDIEEGKFGSLVNVEKQMLSLGNRHCFAILRRQIIAPSLGIVPLAHIKESLAHGGDITHAINVNDEPGRVLNIRLVGRRASNRSSSLSSHSADSIVDLDSSRCRSREVRAGEDYALVAENRAEASAHARKLRRLCVFESDRREIGRRIVKPELGSARIASVVVGNRLDAVKTDFTDAAGASDLALETIDVVSGLFSRLEIVTIPAFMNFLIDSPEICESGAIVGALELKTNEWRLV